MKVVNSRFRILVAEKELRERRKIVVRTITTETGASRSAVEMLLNNTIRHVPLDDLALLCAWVPCEVGELLVLNDLPDAQ
jgi:DNA-binding Xre family transcriptional regulator